jgi:drug/metabolite transporter, DME family
MGGGAPDRGMVLYTLGSRIVPAAELALLSSIEVVLAPIWVWLFLNETADATRFWGAPSSSSPCSGTASRARDARRGP